MLIVVASHDGVVFVYAIIAFIVIVGPLAILAGVDSRIDEKTRQQRFSG